MRPEDAAVLHGASVGDRAMAERLLSGNFRTYDKSAWFRAREPARGTFEMVFVDADGNSRPEPGP